LPARVVAYLIERWQLFCLSSILADHVVDESSDLSRHSALHR
jgi:hypothetical protein